MKVNIISRWWLFGTVFAIGSMLMLVLLLQTSLQGEQLYRHMIRMSVRVSWPILAMVFIASAITTLWPGRWSFWLLQNRKYLGLAFSAVMLWQVLFIFCLFSTGAEIFAPGIGSVFIISDLIGYTLLLLMTMTSFSFFRRKISSKAWKQLHTGGLFYIVFIYVYSFPLGVAFSADFHNRLTYGLLSLASMAVVGVRIAGRLKRDK